MKTFLDRIAKRAGVYVSRPVVNADAWVKWATKFGVPNVLPAEKMHVTVMASRKDVKTKPQVGTYQVFTDQVFIQNLGLDGAVLALAWSCDWLLMDRFYQLMGMGGVSDWPDFRPHVTISYDAKGFEIPDEAMAEMPPCIMFGSEIHAPFDPAAVKAEEAEADDDEGVELEDAACDAAIIIIEKSAGEAWDKLDGFDRQSLGIISRGQPIRKAALERLSGKVDFLEAPSRPTGILKSDAEERMVYGFASVSLTKNGSVVDSHRHTITTKAIKKLVHGLIKGQRAGKLNHTGAKRTDIVESLVFEPDLWKALGAYLEEAGEITSEQGEVFKQIKFEGALVGFHCQDDQVWEMAKQADFELSIGAEEATLQEIPKDA